MADTDDENIDADNEDAAWINEQRAVVESYLSDQDCDHAGVSMQPRWCLSPYVAVWAVRSKKNADAVGWWAISGDVPTDYMSASRDLKGTGDVLAAFGKRWLDASDQMSRGQYVGIGRKGDVAALAPLLRTRADMLIELANDIREDDA